MSTSTASSRPKAENVPSEGKDHNVAVNGTDTQPQLPTVQQNVLEKGLVAETAATVPSASIFDPASFPDGGTRAWLAVLGCFCVMTITFGWIQSVGMFRSPFATLVSALASTSQHSPSLTDICV